VCFRKDVFPGFDGANVDCEGGAAEESACSGSVLAVYMSVFVLVDREKMVSYSAKRLDGRSLSVLFSPS
jgi:hypothetical protein